MKCVKKTLENNRGMKCVEQENTHKCRVYRRARYRRDPHFLQSNLQRLKAWKMSKMGAKRKAKDLESLGIPADKIKRCSQNRKDFEAPCEHFQFKTPFTMVVTGGTMSGKSYFVHQILKNGDKMFVDRKSGSDTKPKHVYIHYGIEQAADHAALAKTIGEDDVSFKEGFPTDEDVKEMKENSGEGHQLLIMDDLADILSNKSRGKQMLQSLFSKVAHHVNISVIFITQNLYMDGLLRQVTSNAVYVVFVKSPKTSHELKVYSKQTYGNTALADIFEQYLSAIKHSYLLVEPAVPLNDYSARYGIFPQDRQYAFLVE